MTRPHRLHAAVVAAIIVVVVIVAAVMTAVLVSSGPATTPTPPVFGGKYGPAKAMGPLQPGIFDGSQTVRGRVVLTSTMTPLADAIASTFDFGGGITMTIAPGWTIHTSGSSSVVLWNGKSAGMYANVGKAYTADINSEASELIKREIKFAGLTNVQQDQSAQVQDVQGGQNFRQSLTIPYTGNVQSNQGTAQNYGMWVILFNQSTNTSAFFDVYAMTVDALTAAFKPDAVNMIGSTT
jgi:hypothetical protein